MGQDVGQKARRLALWPFGCIFTHMPKPTPEEIAAYLHSHAEADAPAPRTDLSPMAQALVKLLGFAPTPEQEDALQALSQYLSEDTDGEVFILKGAAGTGKTSLVRALVSYYRQTDTAMLLAAPTGRAAKVLANKARHFASTIHHLIYRLVEIKDAAGHIGGYRFVPKNNPVDEAALYVIDEASMLGNDGKDTGLGGQLLDDMIEYVFSKHGGSKLILMGDDYQLPPIGLNRSPALDPEFFSKEMITMSARMSRLSAVKRQTEGSLILKNAVMLRGLIDNPPEKPEDLQLDFEYRFGEVEHIENLQEAMETYLSLLDVNAPDSAVFLCYSNFWAYRLNRNIRALLHGEDGSGEDTLPLYRGDRIMVTRNFYFKRGRAVDFLPNGEIGTVVDVDWKSRRTIATLDFVDATFTFVNERGEPYEHEGKVMLNLLSTKDNAVPQDAMRRLRAERKTADDAPTTGTDPFVGALQLKYGHAVTGHKAQGGEWENVFVLIEPAYGGDMVAYLRWLYTVLTRASKRLFIVGR